MLGQALLQSRKGFLTFLLFLFPLLVVYEGPDEIMNKIVGSAGGVGPTNNDNTKKHRQLDVV